MNPEAVAELASLLRSWLYFDRIETCSLDRGMNNEKLVDLLQEWALRFEISPQTLDKLYDRFHRSDDLRSLFSERMRGS